MTRSAVPGYLASAAALALSAAAPVAVVPRPGGVPCALEGALEVAAAGVTVAVVLDEPPHAARSAATATVAAPPARALRERRGREVLIDMPPSSARRAGVARGVSGSRPGTVTRGGARTPASTGRGGRS